MPSKPTYERPIKNKWFAIRVLLHHPIRTEEGDGRLYEERITIWKVGSIQEAYREAETEALQYAREADAVFLRATDGFRLFDECIVSCTEIWSVMRGSFLEPQTYEDTFMNTDRDRKSVD